MAKTAKKGQAVEKAASPTENKAFNFDLKPAKKIRTVREGTKRHKIIQLMSRKTGATVAEITKATGWSRVTAYSGVKLVNTFVGLGLKTDDKGRIHAIGDAK